MVMEFQQQVMEEQEPVEAVELRQMLKHHRFLFQVLAVPGSSS